jgi:hypothetical protein
MADGPTCGQGLAAHSSLPTKFGELTAAELAATGRDMAGQRGTCRWARTT